MAPDSAVRTDQACFKRVFQTGLLAFVVTSALCGPAPTFGVPVFLRAPGAGMTAAMPPAVIPAAFPAAERGRAPGLAALVSLGCFVSVEKRAAEPMLDLGLLQSRVFSTAGTAALLNFMSSVHHRLFHALSAAAGGRSRGGPGRGGFSPAGVIITPWGKEKRPEATQYAG